MERGRGRQSVGREAAGVKYAWVSCLRALLKGVVSGMECKWGWSGGERDEWREEGGRGGRFARL